MAELYLAQGHRDQGVEIYRQLVRDNPTDERAARRLQQLEGRTGEDMSFREHLQQMVESVPGALSAMIMGFDGIAIDSFDTAQQAVDLPTLLIEYSQATQQLRRASETMAGIGELTEVTVARDAVTCLLRPLTEEYFMAMTLAPGGLTGKARFMMRMIAPQIAADLS